jgi:hypothetical protein
MEMTATAMTEVLEEAGLCLDSLLDLGDLEQRCIVSLKFSDLNDVTARKQAYFLQKLELFKLVDSVITSIAGDRELSRDSGLLEVIHDLSGKSFQLKLQNRENSSLLNQIKSFLTSIISNDSGIAHYNARGTLKASGRNPRALVSRKV